MQFWQDPKIRGLELSEKEFSEFGERFHISVSLIFFRKFYFSFLSFIYVISN